MEAFLNKVPTANSDNSCHLDKKETIFSLIDKKLIPTTNYLNCNKQYLQFTNFDVLSNKNTSYEKQNINNSKGKKRNKIEEEVEQKTNNNFDYLRVMLLEAMKNNKEHLLYNEINESGSPNGSKYGGSVTNHTSPKVKKNTKYYKKSNLISCSKNLNDIFIMNSNNNSNFIGNNNNINDKIFLYKESSDIKRQGFIQKTINDFFNINTDNMEMD